MWSGVPATLRAGTGARWVCSCTSPASVSTLTKATAVANSAARSAPPHLRTRLVCRQARRLAQLSNATVVSNSTKLMTCSIRPLQGMATLSDATLTYSAQAHVGFRGLLHPSRTSALDIACLFPRMPHGLCPLGEACTHTL